MPAEPAKLSATGLALGSDAIATVAGGDSVPAGLVHLVEGWLPVCGQSRVRFRFPAVASGDATCPDCRARVSVPRARRRRS